mgnify:CR=1 FL=1
MGVLRSRKSDASSTETGISVSSSKMLRVCRVPVSCRFEFDHEGETHSKTRVVARPARDKDHAAAAAHDGQVRLEAAERDRVRVKVDAATHRVDDRLGLLVDLLLHKVVERALHDGRELNLERLDRADRRHAVVAAQAVDVELCTAGSERISCPSVPACAQRGVGTHLPRRCAQCRRPRGRAPSSCARQSHSHRSR